MAPRGLVIGRGTPVRLACPRSRAGKRANVRAPVRRSAPRAGLSRTVAQRRACDEPRMRLMRTGRRVLRARLLSTAG
jgi:hypothetical protein